MWLLGLPLRLVVVRVVAVVGACSCSLRLGPPLARLWLSPPLLLLRPLVSAAACSPELPAVDGSGGKVDEAAPPRMLLLLCPFTEAVSGEDAADCTALCTLEECGARGAA